jgi:hypothetical protein
LGLCFAPLEAILTWHPTSFAPWLVVPPALGRLRRYSLIQNGVACRFLPEEISTSRRRYRTCIAVEGTIPQSEIDTKNNFVFFIDTLKVVVDGGALLNHR